MIEAISRIRDFLLQLPNSLAVANIIVSIVEAPTLSNLIFDKFTAFIIGKISYRRRSSSIP